ncbi:MAG TPA: hypothetical protein VHQ01_00910 [Pyrinomonadaceae bacterium]|nr:hypothetical protein [Pyrinomonadaceae bacterium]
MLTGAADLLLTDGIPGATPIVRYPVPGKERDSPRRRGVKQGAFLFLLAIFLAPVLGIFIRFALDMRPWPMGIFLFLVGGAGILRIIYALFFESKYPNSDVEFEEMWRHAPLTSSAPPNRELPMGDPSAFIPASPPHAGRWLDTNDLAPHSVTDATTQLLEKEHDR